MSAPSNPIFAKTIDLFMQMYKCERIAFYARTKIVINETFWSSVL